MKIHRKIGIAVGVLIAGTIITLAVLNPTNYAETSENADGELHTRLYDVWNIERRYANEPTGKPYAIIEIEEILSRQTTYGRSWKVVETKTESELTIIKAEVPVIVFTDDLKLEIRLAPPVEPDSPRIKATVKIRSKSRVALSDLGENRRHIKQLLEELDFAFGNDKL